MDTYFAINRNLTPNTLGMSMKNRNLFLICVLCAFVTGGSAQAQQSEPGRPSEILEVKNNIPLMDWPAKGGLLKDWESLQVNAIDADLVRRVDQLRPCTVRGWLKSTGNQNKPFFIYWAWDHQDEFLGFSQTGISSLSDEYLPVKQSGYPTGDTNPLYPLDPKNIPPGYRNIKMGDNSNEVWIRRIGKTNRDSFAMQLRIHKKSDSKTCKAIHAGNQCNQHEADAEYYGQRAGTDDQVFINIGAIVIRDECVGRGLWPLSELWGKGEWADWRYVKPFYKPWNFILFPKF